MKYLRPAYRDPGVRMESKLPAFGSTRIEVPRFETPITPRENFKRAMDRNKPYWAPCSITDLQTIMAQDVVRTGEDGIVIHTDFRDDRNLTEEYRFIDWFGTDWTWVPEAGGAMLTPGTILVEDMTEWEKVVKWPSMSDWDLKSVADHYMKNEYNPDLGMHYDIGRGLTERFISITGGYSEGMLALAEEPEACKDFMDRYADLVIELFDEVNSLYPLDMITYHDDWGTERDTFFSEKMLEELVMESTKKIIKHVQSKNVLFELHTCGNISRFMPHILEMGADVLQIQRRAIDIPAFKKLYGDKISFCCPIEDFEPGQGTTREELIQLVRNTVDVYGKDGGFYVMPFSRDPEELWTILAELYGYSREYYDNVFTEPVK
jgi:hypothetical protein